MADGDRHSDCLVVGGLIGFINGFMVVKLDERLHRDARDADHPARHAGRRDARADLVRPARRVFRLMVITFLGLPLAVWLAALLLRSPASCCATIGWAARFTRSAAIPKPRAPRGFVSSVSPGASSCWPDSGRAGRWPHRLRRRDQRQSGQWPDFYRFRGGGDRRHFARRRQGHDVGRSPACCCSASSAIC